MKKIKVYVVGKATYYQKFIDNSELVKDINEADIVLFTGGEDVTPSMYGEETHKTSYCNINRDATESAVFDFAVKTGKNMLGICRGSQLLTALSGGKLVQNVHNHSMGGRHNIKFDDDSIEEITSTHHQMMYPFDMDAKKYDIVAISHPRRSDIYEFNNKHSKNEITSEPEIVFYHDTKALCIQGHPEYMNKTDGVVIKINSLIKKYFNYG